LVIRFWVLRKTILDFYSTVIWVNNNPFVHYNRSTASTPPISGLPAVFTCWRWFAVLFEKYVLEILQYWLEFFHPFVVWLK
jgi:hypothetical protein